MAGVSSCSNSTANSSNGKQNSEKIPIKDRTEAKGGLALETSSDEQEQADGGKSPVGASGGETG
jgi:hypothetical protein